MDEHGVDDWLYQCTLIGFWLKSWANHISWFHCHAWSQIWPSITHMGQMTNPNTFIIMFWTYQEMMVWMSMELIGSMDVVW
jgi:hypothetical protein